MLIPQDGAFERLLTPAPQKRTWRAIWDVYETLSGAELSHQEEKTEENVTQYSNQKGCLFPLIENLLSVCH